MKTTVKSSPLTVCLQRREAPLPRRRYFLDKPGRKKIIFIMTEQQSLE
jgi:hypothetical protein